MKLNGWQRIGVVASVVWIVCAGMNSLNTSYDREADSAADQVAKSCIDAYRSARGVNPPLGQCDVRADQYKVKLQDRELFDAAWVALIPVPVAWGFAYLVIFTVRWIRRGFGSPPHTKA